MILAIEVKAIGMVVYLRRAGKVVGWMYETLISLGVEMIIAEMVYYKL